MTEPTPADQAAAAPNAATDAAEKPTAAPAPSVATPTSETAKAPSEAAKAAGAVKADTAKAAEAAKADAAKATATVKTGTSKAGATVKAEAAKAGDTVKTGAAKAGDAVKDAVDGEKKATPAPPRSLDEIEADLDATRERLAGRIDELQDYVSPRNVAQRQLDKLKGVFVDEYGGVKPDRVLMAVGAVVAVVGLGVVLRRRRR